MSSPMLPQELPPMVAALPPDPTWRLQSPLSVGLYRGHKVIASCVNDPLSVSTFRRAVLDVLIELPMETHIGTVIRLLLGQEVTR